MKTNTSKIYSSKSIILLHILLSILLNAFNTTKAVQKKYLENFNKTYNAYLNNTKKANAGTLATSYHSLLNARSAPSIGALGQRLPEEVAGIWKTEATKKIEALKAQERAYQDKGTDTVTASFSKHPNLIQALSDANFLILPFNREREENIKNFLINTVEELVDAIDLLPETEGQEEITLLKKFSKDLSLKKDLTVNIYDLMQATITTGTSNVEDYNKTAEIIDNIGARIYLYDNENLTGSENLLKQITNIEELPQNTAKATLNNKINELEPIVKNINAIRIKLRDDITPNTLDKYRDAVDKKLEALNASQEEKATEEKLEEKLETEVKTNLIK